MLRLLPAAAMASMMALGPVQLQAAEDAASAAGGPEITQFTLMNGLDVVVVPDRRAPVVTHMVWYRVGAADEPMGVSGIAHFLEHLMFKGTEANPDGRFSQVVAELGGQENAFTGQDYTGYFQRVAREHLPVVMELEADRMSNLRLTEEAVAPEREVILEERRQRIDNNPGARLGEAMSAALYMNHPYRIPIIGWQHEMEELSREDALAFYDRFYTPNNAILVVAGDVDVETVRTLAEEHYGTIERRAEPGLRNRVDEPAPDTPRRVSLTDARVAQELLRRDYLVPSYGVAEEEDRPEIGPALDILAELLGGGPTSHFYRELVRTGVASNAGSYYRGSSIDETAFGLYAVPGDGVSLEALEEAMDASLARFLDGEIEQSEIDRIVQRLTAEQIYAQDSQAALARLYGAALASGKTVEDVQEWPGRLSAVTVEDVRAAANYLVPERSVTGLLRSPEPETAEANAASPDAKVPSGADAS